MKHLAVVLMALLIPTAAMAKGECKEDKSKFCKDVRAGGGDVNACLKQHEADLSKACQAKLETVPTAPKAP
jgi:cysteine rich repeat protein